MVRCLLLVSVIAALPPPVVFCVPGTAFPSLTGGDTLVPELYFFNTSRGIFITDISTQLAVVSTEQARVSLTDLLEYITELGTAACTDAEFTE
jgi:hypothetical protein